MKERTKRMLGYALARLQESSTWRGIALLAGVAGASLSPDQKEAFVFGGMALSGFIGAAFPDKK